MSTDKLIDRVRALLAKAEATDHEPEAEAFYAKASELMARHAISEDELITGDPRGIERRQLLASDLWGTKPYGSARWLGLCRVAEVYGVIVNGLFDYGARNPDFVVLFGRPRAIDIVLDVFDLLQRQADTVVLGARPQPELVTKMTMGAGNVLDVRSLWEVPDVPLSTFRASVLGGFFVTAARRLSEGLDQAVDDEGGSMLPVLRDDLARARDEAEEETDGKKSDGRIDPAGWNAGNEAGARADLGTTKLPTSPRRALGA